jgi:hypothetical protein
MEHAQHLRTNVAQTHARCDSCFVTRDWHAANRAFSRGFWDLARLSCASKLHVAVVETITNHHMDSREHASAVQRTSHGAFTKQTCRNTGNNRVRGDIGRDH